MAPLQDEEVHPDVLDELLRVAEEVAPETTEERFEGWRFIRRELPKANAAWERGLTQVPTAAVEEVLEGGVSKRVLAKLIGKTEGDINTLLESKADEVKLTRSKARLLRWLRIIIRTRLELGYSATETMTYLNAKDAVLNYLSRIKVIIENPRSVLDSITSKWQAIRCLGAPPSGVVEPQEGETPAARALAVQPEGQERRDILNRRRRWRR